MKKKTRFRLSSDLLVPFCITIFICLLGASCSIYLFYRSFFSSLYKLEEAPIATITFKYKTAQRKLMDRTVWDRLKQNSLLYNGDTVHTSELSAATIHFMNGNTMELLENTMAQIFISQDNASVVDLISGDAFFEASDSSNGMSVFSKGKKIFLKSGSSGLLKEVDADSGRVIFSVMKGDLSYADYSDGDWKNLSEGESLVLKENEQPGPALTVLEPRPNSRILYFNEDIGSVKFIWKTAGGSEKDSVKLVLSSDMVFKSDLKFYDLESAGSVNIKMKGGIYYWKILLNGEECDSGKFQLVQSLAPSLITPVADYEFTFRNEVPVVRFIWSDVNYASSYSLKISSGPNFTDCVIDQNISSNSAIISTLTEGKWYWKIEPYYVLNNIGLANPSEAGIFTIEKKGKLVSPDLRHPAKESIINVESDSAATVFSWKMDDEPLSYNLKVSADKNMKSPFIDAVTSDNFYKLTQEQQNLAEGNYYWCVTVLDAEGNVSAVKEIRSFYAMKGKAEQHIIEPADKYKIAGSLLQDTKFTWKKNLNENWQTEFQVYSDAELKSKVYSEKTNNLSTLAPNLPLGTYYWRISSENRISGALLSTPARELNVLGNLGRTNIIAPTSKLVAREDVPYEIKWTEVPGADFYKIFIYSTSTGELVYEDTVYGTSIKLDMYNGEKFMDRMNYRIEIQAKSLGVTGVCSRRSGDLAERVFYLKKLKPIEILSPVKGSVINGVDAIVNPSYAVWESSDDVSYSQFVLTSVKENKREVVFKVPTDAQMKNGIKHAPNKILLDTPEGLSQGNYEIIVYAETLDGVDISNSAEGRRGYFSVGAITPLQSAKNLTAAPAVFDMEYLHDLNNPRKIKLSWSKVSGATHYLVSIKKDGKGMSILSYDITNNSVTIDFNSLGNEKKNLLREGTFVWTVEALRRVDKDGDGKPDRILQRGKISSGTFVTDVRSPTKSTGKGALNPYGN